MTLQAPERRKWRELIFPAEHHGRFEHSMSGGRETTEKVSPGNLGRSNTAYNEKPVRTLNC